MRTIKILAAVAVLLSVILLIEIRSISSNHPPASKTFWLISFVCPKTGHLFVDDVNDPEKHWDFEYAADDTACHFVIERYLNKALRETRAATGMDCTAEERGDQDETETYFHMAMIHCRKRIVCLQR